MAAEYDPTAEGKRQFAQDAYKTLHPGTPVVGDVFKLDAKDVPDHDVLSFTTPCQSFSVAGKRLGFEDTRGTLVFEALRIANAKRPKALFMENVKGLVNHDKGRTLDTILHAMNEIGYVVDFNVMNSKYFGVPQNRERVFIVAIREDLIEAQPWSEERLKGSTMLPKRYRALTDQGINSFNFDWPAQTSVDKRLKDVLEADVDEKYYLAEDKTAKLVAELSNQRDSVTGEIRCFNPRNISDGTQTRMQDRIYDKEGAIVTVTAMFAGRLNIVEGLPIREATTQGYAVAHEGDAVNIAFPSSKTRRGRIGEQMDNTLEASGCNQGVVEREDSPIMLGHIDLKGHDAIKRVYSPTGQGPTLTTMGGGHREPKIAEEGPNEEERNTAEILRTLWREIGEEAFAKWGFRVLDSLQQKEILQSGLYEESIYSKESADEQAVGKSKRKTSREILHGSDCLSDMWVNEELGCPPHRRESSQQRIEQLIVALSKLSYEDAQTAETMQNLWSEAQGVGVLRKALSEIQKIWKSANDKPRYRIRKLTPREAMRLQGFPESATDALYAEGFSDSRVYKFAGNAVTTTVIKALAERLAPQINAKGAI